MILLISRYYYALQYTITLVSFKLVHTKSIILWFCFWQVPQNSTVRELKKAVARHFELYQQRMGNRVKISWRYIWKTYSLNYDSLTLDKDDSKITDYGVTNKVILTFKKIRRKPRWICNFLFSITIKSINITYLLS